MPYLIGVKSLFGVAARFEPELSNAEFAALTANGPLPNNYFAVPVRDDESVCNSDKVRKLVKLPLLTIERGGSGRMTPDHGYSMGWARAFAQPMADPRPKLEAAAKVRPILRISHRKGVILGEAFWYAHLVDDSNGYATESREATDSRRQVILKGITAARSIYPHLPLKPKGWTIMVEQWDPSKRWQPCE